MRSSSPISRPDRWLAALLLLAACGAGEATAGSAPDRIVTGPQGDVGQFVVECRLDRLLADDPIVLPNRPGASHLHQFFGAVGVTAGSTTDELLGGSTTCDQPADTASYWTPTLIGADRRPIEPVRSVAYYRAGPGVDPTLVEPYPPGFMMVAGDHAATEPQPVSLVAWTCGTGGTREPEPPDCSGATSLRMLVTFADCWNGLDIRSPIVTEPGRHVAYSTQGRCPDGFPVHIPQLQFAVDWPVPDTTDGLALSSGDIHSGHADFWNAWNPDKLEREVAVCIGRDLACNVSG